MMDFSSEQAVPWYEYRSLIRQVVLPDGLTNISKYAFSGCSSLQEITIPKSVTYIEHAAFYSCNKLKKITILNPRCYINESTETISSTAIIYGYNNSTAEEYAELHDRRFISLGDYEYGDNSGSDDDWGSDEPTTSIPDYPGSDEPTTDGSDNPEWEETTHPDWDEPTTSYPGSDSSDEDDHWHDYTYNLISEGNCQTPWVIYWYCEGCGDGYYDEYYGDCIDDDGDYICDICGGGEIYTKNLPATGHTDDNADGYCDICDEDTLDIGIDGNLADISFIGRMKAFFQKIADFFKNLFNFA